MKTLLCILTASLFLTACSSTPPQPKEPKGKWQQINSAHYYIDNAPAQTALKTKK